MAEINLLKNELRERGPFTFGFTGLLPLYIVLGVLALEVLIYGGLFIYQNSLQNQIEQAEKTSGDLEFQISQIDQPRKAAVAKQRQLNNIAILLDKHVFWSPVFDELEKYILKSAALTTLEVDHTDAKFVISGTVPSYTDLGKMILGLRRSSNITDVVLKSSSQGKDAKSGYLFHIEVKFNPQLLVRD